eukprot:4349853-Amphidinium_carterae.1
MEVTNKIADVEARQAQLLQRIFELEGSGTNGSGLTPAYLEELSAYAQDPQNPPKKWNAKQIGETNCSKNR